MFYIVMYLITLIGLMSMAYSNEKEDLHKYDDVELLGLGLVAFFVCNMLSVLWPVVLSLMVLIRLYRCK